MTPIKKITKAELSAIVADYYRLLPAWHHVRDGTIGRAEGPLMQAIGFECLRGGDYRPMHYVSALVTPEPGGGFFHQIPRGWPGTLLLRQHAEFHRRLFETMKREFRPPITEDFDALTMLELCEQNAVPKGNQAYELAALNAYFGRDGRARYWCSRFPKLVEELAFPWQPWDLEQKAFLDSLACWIDKGEATSRLQEILKIRRKREGFN
jgi:hypothetical protein